MKNRELVTEHPGKILFERKNAVLLMSKSKNDSFIIRTFAFQDKKTVHDNDKPYETRDENSLTLLFPMAESLSSDQLF